MMVEDCAGTPSGGSCPAHPLVTFHGRNPPMKLLRPLGAFAALLLLVAPGLTAQAAPAPPTGRTRAWTWDAPPARSTP